MIEIEILYTLVQSLQIYNISIEVTVMIYLEVHSARLCLFKMPCGKKKHSKEYSVDEFFKNEFSTGCHDCQEPRGFCESLQCLLVLIK